MDKTLLSTLPRLPTNWRCKWTFTWNTKLCQCYWWCRCYRLGLGCVVIRDSKKVLSKC